MGTNKASMGRVALIGLFAVLVGCAMGERTVATAQCSCAKGVASRFERSDHIFVATVVKIHSGAVIRNGEKFDEIEFKVRTSWKRDIAESVTVLARREFADPFKIGDEWLIFAIQADDDALLLDQHCCSWVKPLEKSRKSGEYDQLSRFAKTTKNIHP